MAGNLCFAGKIGDRNIIYAAARGVAMAAAKFSTYRHRPRWQPGGSAYPIDLRGY
jgi:hypothetical protein